ncbi:respiratory nitrate reductase subunit gamma [Mycobacterium intermedium]|uniref:Nitrate reductase-like protein NarX n=1 Tax=Mycobacterium intermedium TaxID=28445 RepID=A0A1E3SEV7_MYCIE|nr:respiratory nitrate reductase subunit gamma [Mycobacterium intermedium]MCV6965163.1 respiratory nitrate reductase subunit gamma [Mycobacterium intermedium]ODR00108.1 respiratory nitrate reductase subunit gamma [Mycobacterium intermedium]OPE48015.1 respiratory nitrate reductase subunit gamma [Mycobacterium intermedium]ORA99909.1 respiratory nitrate reductase subunit gamma [Mycobacterium intermedium]
MTVKLIEIFWDDVPYVVLAIVVIGAWWRYRYDKFGWTTRSSQLYESRLLSIGSPLFHFGSLMVIMGHVAGLFIPESWTRDMGMSDHLYHLQALLLGIPAGAATLIGIGLLIYRRRVNPRVRLATTRNDKLMYVVLVCALVAGMSCTLIGATHFGELHDYRQRVSVWFRSIWILDPRGDLMSQAAFYYQLHVLLAMMLFALWPYTRLVHAFSAPVMYLFRPYIVYRSRDVADDNQLVGSAPRRRGW